ncbi:MAG: phosphoribosylglycinamide formyltransferase [Saprospiraceae bacterium]|nr:phosphoribosylglycinamide formyltransferase [Bacteroidia bacterium]NNE15932.1 phosphoribosylglycinamide formyltransferase [Saprospiraceae bacterium]NNL93653.1 phosphoribosylglycinamide formyltransferase [Saprospiraceae bacterium]
MSKTNIAIFASGSGSNAEKIIAHFDKHDNIQVSLIISNNKDAFVLQRGKNHNIQTQVFSKKEFHSQDKILACLKSHEIDFIILAGFLLLIPQKMTIEFKDRIINIHPALLPKYGGKGMYGHHVHQAVFDNFEKKSGMTIHLVNEKYDEGKILFQDKVELLSTDTPDIIGKKVLALEHKHFAPVVEKYITNFAV